jgi:hypothetical protein
MKTLDTMVWTTREPGSGAAAMAKGMDHTWLRANLTNAVNWPKRREMSYLDYLSKAE